MRRRVDTLLQPKSFVARKCIADKKHRTHPTGRDIQDDITDVLHIVQIVAAQQQTICRFEIILMLCSQPALTRQERFRRWQMPHQTGVYIGGEHGKSPPPCQVAVLFFGHVHSLPEETGKESFLFHDLNRNHKIAALIRRYHNTKTLSFRMREAIAYFDPGRDSDPDHFIEQQLHGNLAAVFRLLRGYLQGVDQVVNRIIDLQVLLRNDLQIHIQIAAWFAGFDRNTVSLKSVVVDTWILYIP